MNHSLKAARAELLEYALSFPETREDHPWGESVAKVGKKVFVFFGRSSPDDPRLLVAVKLPKSGLGALDLPFAEPAGYGMGKHGWVTAIFTAGDRPDLDLLRGWVRESYGAIARKKLLKLLEATPAAPRTKPKATPPKRATRKASARAKASRVDKKPTPKRRS